MAAASTGEHVGAALIVHAIANRAPQAGALLVVDGPLRATTDSDGTAVVRGLAAGRHRAWLLADGWADERLDFSVLDDPEAVHEYFITLHPGSRIAGRVVDQRGVPVANANVGVIARDGQLRYHARSDVAGNWVVNARAGSYRANASTGGTWSPLVSFTCDGRTPCDVVVQLDLAEVSRPSAARDRAEVPAGIAGTVVDSANEPVAGATVRALMRGTEANSSYTFARATAQTDENGRFELDGLDEGEHEVVVDAPGPDDHRTRRAPHRVRAGDLNVRIVVPQSGAISGRALLDGAPLSYFGVALTPTKTFGGQPIGLRATDGRFELRRIPPGIWRVSLLAPGTRLWFVDDVRVEPGLTTSLGDIALPGGVRISGVVRDASGAPVAGARVCVGSWTRHEQRRGSRLEQAFHGEFWTASDDAGGYRFDGVEPRWLPHRPALIWATHPARGASILRQLSETDAAIDLDLVATGDLEATIDGLRGGRPAMYAVRADEPAHARMSFLDGAGRYRFEDLPAGEYVVRLGVDDAEQVAPVAVTVRPDETVVARLAMTTSSVRLTIRVPDGRGHDLVLEPTSDGAGVGGRVRGITRTGNEDRCRFEFVRPGTYRASLDGTHWHSIAITASPAEQTIDLRFHEA